jgi:hypothetical protein
MIELTVKRNRKNKVTDTARKQQSIRSIAVWSQMEYRRNIKPAGLTGRT